jgi:hypothetical protein
MSILTSISTSARLNRGKLAKRWATEMFRGKTGGAYGMNLFDSNGLYNNLSQSEINAYHNSRDPGELPYNINPNLWCAELLPQLTCCSIHKDEGQGGGAVGTQWRHRYGRIAITKRHMLSCNHAHSAASGTWNGVVNTVGPCRIRFMDSLGNSVDRVQIHQASDPFGADLNVAVLDQDLPDSIYIPKVAPSNYISELVDYQVISMCQEFQLSSRPDGLGSHYANWLYQMNISPYHGIYYDAVEAGDAGAGIVINHIVSGTGTSISVSVSGREITITHGSSATTSAFISAINSNTAAKALVTGRLWGNNCIVNRTLSGVLGGLLTPYSDYPLLNRQMIYCPNISNIGYGVWKGDSGTPLFTVLNGELIVTGIISGGSSNSHSPQTMTWPTRLNNMIAAADANAISLGRMSTPTGYTVTPYTGRIL